MIILYDLDDNIITFFDNYKECAKYFNTSCESIRSHLSRIKSGQIKKKLNKQDHKWYKILKVEDDD